jgi:hypothetical protein
VTEEEPPPAVAKPGCNARRLARLLSYANSLPSTGDNASPIFQRLRGESPPPIWFLFLPIDSETVSLRFPGRREPILGSGGKHSQSSSSPVPDDWLGERDCLTPAWRPCAPPFPSTAVFGVPRRMMYSTISEIPAWIIQRRTYVMLDVFEGMHDASPPIADSRLLLVKHEPNLHSFP